LGAAAEGDLRKLRFNPARPANGHAQNTASPLGLAFFSLSEHSTVRPPPIRQVALPMDCRNVGIR